MSALLKSEIETKTTPTLPQKPKRQKRQNYRWMIAPLLSTFALSACVALLLSSAIQNALGGNTLVVPVPQERAPALTHQVALQQATAQRANGFITLDAVAANQTPYTLKNVQAVVELLDKEGNPLYVETALLSTENLSANQKTSFQILLPDKARTASYRVQFREMMGKMLN
jgi:hypothetical protein